uniref:tRNA (carboxymethyluridine(34)-5-O)-methyltransferase n=1 Tax=Clastoptera arizonana TaxID=38151 RepID=A0A1B6E4R5_9HEMI
MEGQNKHSRKISKKQHRYQRMLLNDTGIGHSDFPTKFLMVCNAGLVSGIHYEDVVEMFSKFGSLEKALMIPGKSYCFVVYEDIKEAVFAYEMVNGNCKLEKMDGPIYLLFLQGVPDTKHLICYDKLPDGLTLIEDFISKEEEENLLLTVHWEEINSQLGKVMKHRKVKHYGYEFRYDNNNVDKDKPLSEKIPEQCGFINERLKEKGFLNLLSWIPDQLTVNQYQKGQGIPSHIDTHSAFESPILSLSMGSDVVMEFKLEDKHIPVFLPRRSLLVMDGPARFAWSHGITPRTMDVICLKEGLTVQERNIRTSFTFRRIRQGECYCSYHKYCDSWKPEEVNEEMASKLESTHVHQVYDTIASHFSETRSKIWPNVRIFIESLTSGSFLVDVGCGNGKYFGVNKNVYQIGCDHSKHLATVTYDRGNEVFVCNCLNLPLRSNIADGVISIAVLHHLSTEQRRLQAIKEIIRILSINGKALIYVWAKTQCRSKMSSYLKQDRKNRRKEVSEGNEKYKSELLTDGLAVSNSINDDNRINNSVNSVNVNASPQPMDMSKSDLSVNLPIHNNRTDFQYQDLLVPWKMKSSAGKELPENKRDETFLRYYHVFEEGEIENVCSRLENVHIVRSYYDEGNWCIILEKIKN